MDHRIDLHERLVTLHKVHVTTLHWKQEAAADCDGADYDQAARAVEQSAADLRDHVQTLRVLCPGCRHDHLIEAQLKQLASS